MANAQSCKPTGGRSRQRKSKGQTGEQPRRTTAKNRAKAKATEETVQIRRQSIAGGHLEYSIQVRQDKKGPQKGNPQGK